MAKKIYDIKPPKVARKTTRTTKTTKEVKVIKASLQEEKIFTKAVEPEKVQHTHHKKEKKSFWMPVSVGVLVVLLVVGVYLFVKLPKASITIWPKVDTLSFKQTIIADKSVTLVDATKEVIPAQYFEASKTVTQDFPATGSGADGGLSSGTITIYNKFDPPQAFTFKAGTHFMSDSGKLFVAMQKIVIPAAKKSGSKITPGSVQVQVQAVENGDNYNIAPSNFSIPGLKGADAYYSVYATSSTAMSGGYAGKVKKVTDDDIQGAKDVLVKKASADAMVAVKNQIPSDYVLLDNATSSITTDASTQTKTGAIADKFTYKVAVKISALAFKKSDVDKFAKSYINSQASVGKSILDSTYKMTYSASTVDVSGGKETLNLDFSSGVYQSIDVNAVSLSVLGKDENQIKQTINNNLNDQVSNIKVNFWPFWVKSAPDNQSSVSVKLKFN